MRRLFSIGILLVLAVSALAAGCAATSGPAANAADRSVRTADAGTRVVLAIRTPRHLEAAMVTAEQMQGGEGLQAEEVAIIVCGPAVEALRQTGEQAAAVRAVHARGVRVVACGMSLEELQIDAATLLPEVEIVPNGLTEIIRLQTEGYYSIEL